MGLQDTLATKTPDAATGHSRTSREERARRRNVQPITPATGQIQDLNELERVTAKLAEYEGSLPTRKLDPSRIRYSSFANRHEDHFESDGFAQLREDIASAGGNVQPIRVRPVQGDPNVDYEVIYGHRRLRACLDLKLPVEAVIAEANDEELFEAMSRENSSREDLSAYEEGLSYKRALDLKLYSSQHKLAAAVGITQARVSQVLNIANLPAQITEAFPSPLKIQSRWADAIQRKLKEDQSGVLAIAGQLKADRSLTAKQVYETLIAKPKKASVDVVVEGKRRAVIRSNLGVVTVSFAKNALPTDSLDELASSLEQFLAAKKMVVSSE